MEDCRREEFFSRRSFINTKHNFLFSSAVAPYLCIQLYFIFGDSFSSRMLFNDMNENTAAACSFGKRHRRCFQRKLLGPAYPKSTALYRERCQMKPTWINITAVSYINFLLQASNALCSVDTAHEDPKYSVSRRSHRLERMAEEFLYRVQARRKRARSYCYLVWFLLLFITFLSTQFLKEVRPLCLALHPFSPRSLTRLCQDNRNLFTVDKSIKTRVVNILPKGAGPTAPAPHAP